jgi:sarcosine oxidase
MTKVRHTVDTDVVVVGLGAMGSMALWRLAQRGVRVVGVEQFTPGHARGSSHGGSRIFRVAVFEGAEYVSLAQLAHRLWRELEHQAGEQLLITTGALMFGSQDSDVMTGSRQVAEQFDLAHEWYGGAEEMRRRWPQFAFADSDVGLLDRDGGALRPEQAIRAACREAARLGAEIMAPTTVLGVHVDGARVLVETSDAIIRADKAVVAVGAWTNHLLPEAGLPLEIRRAIMTWFRGTPAEQFLPASLPVFITDGREPGGWGIPNLDGLGLKLGHDDASHIHTLARPEDNTPTVTSGETAPYSALCRATFPSLDPRPVHTQVCMTTHTPDQGFVVGPMPGAGNVTLMAGFSGHGFKHAAGLGEIAAQLVAEGGTPYDLRPFSADRFAGTGDAESQKDLALTSGRNEGDNT